jgi:NAD(P)H dehydrogenase (quinone)
MLVLSGASGNLGRAITRELLGAVDPSGVRLVTREPAGLTAPEGVEVRAGDMNDPDGLRQAYAGGTDLLIISTDTVDGRETQHIAAIDAARAAGVERVIYTSMISPDGDNPALIAPSHLATEQHLRASGLAWTIVRCGFYSDFQAFEAADALRSGVLRHNRGDGRCAYVAREDCARSLAAVLGGSGHSGMVYELTGPDALGADDLGALYAKVGGAPVEVVPLDDAEFLRELSAGSGDEGHVHYGVALTVSLGRAIREGRYGEVTTTVRELTGRDPLAVEHMLLQQQGMLRDAAAGRA